MAAGSSRIGSVVVEATPVHGAAERNRRFSAIHVVGRATSESQLPWPSSPVPPPATSPNHAHGGWRLQRLTVAAVDEVEASPIGSASTSLFISDFDVHAVEGVARHLCPNAIFLHRHLVHLDIVNFELAGLLVHPKIDVVVLVLAAGLAEVSAGEILPFLLQMA